MTTLWMLFTWWFWILIIGWAALPLAWRLFGRFPDRGYALAKPLGLLLWAYALWLGSTVGALHNTLGGAVTAILFVLALSYLLARDAWRPDEQRERPLWRWLREHRGEVLFTEGLFLIAYLVWAYVRANSPDIATAGGEKFMEIAFINGVLTSRLFPPHDPWLAGYAISYYYFGYVMIGGLIQLSRVPASVGFNLAGASWFALTVVSAYGVVRGLIGFRRRENGHRVWGTGRGGSGFDGQPGGLPGGALRPPPAAGGLLAVAGHPQHQRPVRPEPARELDSSTLHLVVAGLPGAP